jgi:hypothetical protein
MKKTKLNAPSQVQSDLEVRGRRPHENYPTPFPLALEITRRVSEVVGPADCIIEPSAGEGPFIRAARIVYPAARIDGIDIRGDVVRQQCLDAGADRFFGEDWLEHLQRRGRLDERTLIIGNPPFWSPGPRGDTDLAMKHIIAALDHLPAGGHLAFLLPLRYHGGQERTLRLWSRGDLLAWFSLPQRPSFVDGGTANAEYAIFVWRAGFKGHAMRLEPLWLDSEVGQHVAKL